MHVFMKQSFPKHDPRTWLWHCNLDFFLLALKAFWKRALHLLILVHYLLYVLYVIHTYQRL